MRTRIAEIEEAQRRVDVAREYLLRLPVTDPRWEGSYLEFARALYERALAVVLDRLRRSPWWDHRGRVQQGENKHRSGICADIVK